MKPSEKKLKDLDDLISGIETAMFTTRRTDGHLVSRPMATQGRIADADLWFVTNTDTHKVDEIEVDPNVNCAYYKSGEWVSVSGRARVSKDRHRIRNLYKNEWKAWFPNEGGKKTGGADDPRIALILVDVDSVTYMKNDKPRPVILWEGLKARVTGHPPDIGDVKEIGGAELMD